MSTEVLSGERKGYIREKRGTQSGEREDHCREKE